jgi:uncharacterized protein
MPLGTTKTPCIGICKMDIALGICIGCGRTRSEIGRWMGISDGEADAIMQQCTKRLEVLYGTNEKESGC